MTYLARIRDHADARFPAFLLAEAINFFQIHQKLYPSQYRQRQLQTVDSCVVIALTPPFKHETWLRFLNAKIHPNQGQIPLQEIKSGTNHHLVSTPGFN